MVNVILKILLRSGKGMIERGGKRMRSDAYESASTALDEQNGAFLIPEEVSELVKSWSLQTGVPAPRLLLTSFAAWTARQSGEETVTLHWLPEGSALSGQQEEQPVYYSLIFDTQLSTGADMLERLSEATMHAEPVPAGEACTAVFAYRAAEEAELPFEMQVQNGFGVSITETEQGWRVLWFGRPGLEDSWLKLLAGLAENPERLIADIPLLSEEERHRILVEWNDRKADYPLHLCIHEVFEEQVRKTPDALAVVHRGKGMTYAELNRLANRIAHALREKGVGREVLVGLCTERSLEMIAAMLGVMKAGGAYVPLDPSYPADRLAYMLEDSNAKVLLLQSHLTDRLPAHDLEMIFLDGGFENMTGEAENPVSGAASDSLCYIMYTSGTTGRPKGILTMHRGVINHVLAMQKEFQLGVGDRILQFGSISFDITIQEIFPALFTGATLVLREDEMASAADFAGFLRREQVNVMCLPTAYWHTWVHELSRTGEALPESLRVVLCGGEKPSADVYAAWCRLPGSERIQWINAYGPTETTVSMTAFRASHGQTFPDGTIPIGRPIDNVTTYVLDPSLQPVPVGMDGELYIGGPGLARGYLNRPKETADKFIPSPFVAGERLYKTGDLVRWLPDGQLLYIGRADHQVKLRGFRIELGEIEAVLGQHAAVKQAMVMAREEADEMRLVAYVVARDVSEAELRSFCSEKLPRFMVPSAIMVMDEFPITPNGKVDRKALPKPVYAREVNEEAAPRTPAEEKLAAIWQEVLHLPAVGTHDNFFDLGGHSLSAMQVLSRIRQQFGAGVTLDELFAAPTIAQLAVRIEELAASDDRLEEIGRLNRTGSSRASYAQEQMYVLDQMEGGNPAYNVYKAFRLTGALDAKALERSFRAIISRHEALRTVFSLDGEQLVQTIKEDVDFALVHDDLRNLPEEERVQAAMKRAEAESAAPFDLEKGPLLRAVLLRLKDQEHWLLLTLHHIISDGWSMHVLVRELSAHYERFVRNAEGELAPLAVQYADVSAWQRTRLESERGRLTSYWKERLAGIPALLGLPTDHPRPQVLSHRGGTVRFEIPLDLSAKLGEFGKREQATPYMVLLAAFQTLLYRYTSQEDIVVGSPVAGRIRPEMEDLIGYFVNTLVLRTDFSSDSGLSFRELLGRVRESVLGAFAHQELPFETLVEEIAPERSPSYNPIFQAMFVLQNAPDAEWKFGGVTVEEVDVHNGTTKFDVSLIVEPTPDGWFKAQLEYNAELFERETIRRMAGHLLNLLSGAVEQPDVDIGMIPLLSEAERRQLLYEWNDTKVEYERGVTLHGLFERQAAATPERTALRFEGSELSYRELNERANRLARILQRSGVGPDVMVGVCMERSVEMVVSLLAILKAGGAYVPIDPSYPAERIAYLIGDASAGVLLTQERLIASLPEGIKAKVICVDHGGFEAESADNVEADVTEDHLAYVIYTSGSTGKPKGAMIPHKGIVNRILWMQDEYRLTEQDRVLQKTPFSFDVSVWEFFWPLLTGAVLVVAKPGGHQDPSYLAELIRTEGITTLHFVPSMLQVFLEEPTVSTCTSVRRVMCSGEALPYSLQERFFESFATAELHNLYGPTEASVDVTYWACQRQSEKKIVPIGRPIANIQMYVLDKHLNPVPIGVAGELMIGGIGLARGYHNRPELTAEKFIANPYADGEYDRLYRTGDLARFLPDGTIEYLGRLDHQVKIRGFRIELGEIETALAGHAAVREVVVIAREDEPGEKRLAAYLVLKSGHPRPEVRELQQYLQERLPEYMTPSFFVMLDALPLTPNGKVDRKALPKPERAVNRSAGKELVEPRNEQEAQMAEIWKQVLRMEHIGVRDNFFELGGDSILAMQIIAKANRIGWRLKPKDLFQFQTVEKLVQASKSSRLVAEASEAVEGVALLTPIQRWFFEQNQPEPAHWNLPLLVEVTGAVPADVLRQAVEAVVLAHDAFRLRYERMENEWVQRYAEAATAGVFHHVDLSDLPEAEQSAALEAHARDLQGTLDLAKGPLFKAVFYDFGANRSGRLLLLLHHLIADGVTWRILLEDLQEACEQLQQGETVTLPLKSSSYKQWSRRLHEHAQTEQVRKELAYWTQEPRRSVKGLPVDFPGGVNSESSADTVVVTLDADRTRELLHETSKAYRTQVQEVLLTALLSAANNWTGQSYLLLDLEGHGRENLFDEIDLTRTVGWFTSLYPVLLQSEGHSQPGDLLKAVKEQVRQVPNKGIGYGMLRYLCEDSKTQEALAALPKADVIFNYLGQFDALYSGTPLFQQAAENIGPLHSPLGMRTHLLEIYGGVENGCLVMRFVYSQNVHRQATIEKLASDFLEQLQALIKHCLAPDAGGHTPSDFKGARLSQGQLDKFLSRLQGHKRSKKS
jgi:amino acid adenylation domain-containing protein/non-ribosomal peptide synthase protein (TIGR01720 family)